MERDWNGDGRYDEPAHGAPDGLGRLVLGGAGLLAGGLVRVISDEGRRPELGRRVTAFVDTASGMVMAAGPRMGSGAAAVSGLAEATCRRLNRIVSFAGDVTGVQRRLEAWAQIGAVEQRRNERAALDALRALTRAVAESVVKQVDVDGVAARVDADAVVARVDVASIVQRVLDEIDVNQIVRESSSTMAAETVDALRVQGIRADRLVSRFVDRILMRRDERQTDLDDPSPGIVGEAGARA